MLGVTVSVMYVDLKEDGDVRNSTLIRMNYLSTP